jgi:hypothetical protein
MLTRGVEDNRVYVVCRRRDGADLGAPTQDPLSVLATILERNDLTEELSAVAVRDQSAERRVSAELRAARTEHGEAIADAGPESPAALEAAAQTETLAAAAAQLESAQRIREVWRQATSGLQARAAVAAVELAARADARVGAPFADMHLSTLEAELAQVEQRLATATTVAERHERLAEKWWGRADEVAAKLAGVTANRPHVSIAEDTVRAERALAERMDELDAALGRGRLNRPVRGAAREKLVAERHELVKTNPALAVEAARREQRGRP